MQKLIHRLPAELRRKSDRDSIRRGGAGRAILLATRLCWPGPTACGQGSRAVRLSRPPPMLLSSSSSGPGDLKIGPLVAAQDAPSAEALSPTPAGIAAFL